MKNQTLWSMNAFWCYNIHSRCMGNHTSLDMRKHVHSFRYYDICFGADLFFKKCDDWREHWCVFVVSLCGLRRLRQWYTYSTTKMKHLSYELWHRQAELGFDIVTFSLILASSFYHLWEGPGIRVRLTRAQLITCFSLVYFIVEPNSLKTCDREVLPWRGHAERLMVAFVKHDYQFALNLRAVAFLPRLVHL